MAAGLGKRLSWRVEAGAHSLVAVMMCALPAASVFRVGEFLGHVIWPFMKLRQYNITRNLRIASAPLDPVKAKQMAKASFIQSVANLMSSSISSKAKGGTTREMLEIENPELLEEAAAEGRGVVLLLAHMGNWELLTRLQTFFPEGVKCGGFYRPLNNPILNERVLKERQAAGATLFSKRDSLHQVGSFLRENGVIGILADQRVGMQGEVVSFFGRLTRVSPLPSLLVRRCKSEVLALSLTTVAPGKWRAKYHKAERPYHSANCMAALETAMRASLLDVFWLQERWKIYLSNSGDPSRWLKKEESRGLKPHRGLVWQGANELPEDLPKGWDHGDIEWEFLRGRSPADIDEIDRSKPLPIDFIVIFEGHRLLRRYAKQLRIPVLKIQRPSE
jgi:KDO2-lipid IV(A) lauroyltransferase